MGKQHNIGAERFRSSIWKIFLTVRAAGQWDSLSREVVESPCIGGCTLYATIQATLGAVTSASVQGIELDDPGSPSRAMFRCDDSKFHCGSKIFF